MKRMAEREAKFDGKRLNRRARKRIKSGRRVKKSAKLQSFREAM